MKSTADIVRIVSHGGGVIVDSSKATDDLVRIASQAATSGATVIIRGAGNKSMDDLVRIASHGKGKVIMEL